MRTCKICSFTTGSCKGKRDPGHPLHFSVILKKERERERAAGDGLERIAALTEDLETPVTKTSLVFLIRAVSTESSDLCG